jgi:hypothetical protein
VVDARDALLNLRISVFLPVELPKGCDRDRDVDCSSGVNAIDALKILRYSASLPVPHAPSCPALGAPY